MRNDHAGANDQDGIVHPKEGSPKLSHHSSFLLLIKLAIDPHRALAVVVS